MMKARQAVIVTPFLSRHKYEILAKGHTTTLAGDRYRKVT